MAKLPAPEMPGWLARELPFERYRLELGSNAPSGQRLGRTHQTHVMEAGDPAGKPVLMLHGNPTWGFLWRKVAGLLADSGLRLVMPDLLGLGFSEKPRDPCFHQLDYHAQLIAHLLDRLELSDLVFVGQDWGGPIGLRALAEQPARLRGLVLLNTVVGPPRPGFRPTAFHRFARLPVLSELAFRGLGFPQTALWSVQGDKRSIRGTVARAYRYPLRKWRDNVAPLALARMVPDDLEHPSVAALRRCQALIEQFRGPTEIVWGDRDPVLGRVRTHVERLLPHARVTRTEAGHFLQEEVPEPIAQAIRRVSA
jgi:pimeloyl-ACP methyl ester carboxylesterase